MCETQHHPRQSRSQAGSIYRCESRRHHPGQGQQTRHGPQPVQDGTMRQRKNILSQEDNLQTQTNACRCSACKNTKPCTNYGTNLVVRDVGLTAQPIILERCIPGRIRNSRW